MAELPCSDDREMVLPVSTCAALNGGCQRFPLPLQRAAFFSCLPLNRDLLEILENGLETGCAFRSNWEEHPVQYSDTHTSR
eukprot:2131508-Karenia_brevis.AAC.1